MALSASALITVEDAMSWLRQSWTAGTDEYQRLESLINNLSSAFRFWLQRPIIAETFTEEYDGSGDAILFLNYYPVSSITYLKVYTDTSYTLRYELSTEQYFLYADEGKVVLKPQNQLLSVFPAIYRAVEIQYSAGLAADRTQVPGAIKQAMLEAIQFFWKEQEVPTQTFGEQPLVIVRRLPQVVQELLFPYVRILFGVV